MRTKPPVHRCANPACGRRTNYRRRGLCRRCHRDAALRARTPTDRLPAALRPPVRVAALERLPASGRVYRKDLCTLLGVTNWTLWNWARTGVFPLTPGGHERNVGTWYRAEHVRWWLLGQPEEPTV